MDEDITVAPGYAVGRLQAALETALTSADEATRARAAGKVRQWRAVLDGVASGGLTVGSRTPVADVPAWVTLEVAHGGFATGRLLAEAPPDDAERTLLSTLPSAPGTTERGRLNRWYLTDDGQAALLAALRDGHYRVALPEHAALPAVALLLDAGEAEAALDLAAELHPFLDRLRFTPEPAEAPRAAGTLVHRWTVGDVVDELRQTTTPPQIDAMIDAILLWNPLVDEVVALWASTVDGELPQLVDRDGATVVEGGWPARRWPEDWAARRQECLEWHGWVEPSSGPSRHRHPRSTFTRLFGALEKAGTDGSGLTARDVGWVRRALAGTVTRHGAPGSERRAALRAAQAVVGRRPTFAALARVAADRLSRFPGDGGIPSLDPLLVETAEGEAERVPAGVALPDTVVEKAAMALEAPVDELVARGIVPSGEVLAAVLPQLTSGLLSAHLSDARAAGLRAAAYAAFRRRRSLLLLDLQHQVRFEELPWVGALDAFRTDGGRDTGPALGLLRDTVLLALDTWPERILPNPLLRELGALASQAGVALSLVEEVAADIFTGTFTVKWRSAAETAARVLQGSLYARYYDLPLPGQWAAARDRRTWTGGRRTADDFAELCRRRAVEAGRSSYRTVAGNGTVLEQSQILTTQNLAALVEGLDLGDALRERAPELARRTLDRIVLVSRQLPSEPWRALPVIKNMAYGWRQAIFYLSFCDPREQRKIVRALPDAGRLAPAVRGLEHVLAAGSFAADGTVPGGTGRRLLGWTVGTHWLLAG